MSVISRINWRLVALPLLPVMLGGEVAIAQSITPAADGTGTIVQQQNGHFQIQGGQPSGDGHNLFHSFDRFGLTPGEVAHFLSQPEIRNILGRVVGGDPSVLNGLIQLTGGPSNLFLLNPAGVFFGPNASLNVPADFTATTATSIRLGANWFNVSGPNNYAALVGAPNAFAFTTAHPSALFNAGNLQVGAGHRLTLMGGSVLNTGQLAAPGGEIILAAVPGESLVRLSQAGMALSLEVQPLATATEHPAAWTLPTTDLPALLTAGNSGHATGATVNAQGHIVLTGSGVQIDPQMGTAIAAGQLNAANPLNGVGGSIAVLGNRVAAIDAAIDASGTNGGGTILLGGDYQGQGSVPNATQTFVNQNSTLRADALSQGNGGRVILWADDRTQFQGYISAQGGNNGGDGGFVEVSGKNTLMVDGSIDVTAPQGINGNILLDPRDIIIRNGGGAANDNQLDAGTPPGSPAGEILFADGGPLTDFTISKNALTALTGNVLLQADRDIIFQNGVTLNFANQTAGETVTFEAGNNIVIEADIFQTAGGSLRFEAGNTIDIKQNNVDLGTQSGNLSLFADQILMTGNASSLDAGTGNLTLSANEIQLDNSAELRGQGNITLQPQDPTVGISIGGINTDGRLNLDNSELNTLKNGFSEIIIGRADGTGALQLNSFNFKDPVRIAGGTSLTGPNQNTTWTIAGQNSGSLSGFNQPVTFENIENLVGGSGIDTFRLVGAAAQITGGIDGGLSSGDTLDYSAYTGGPVTVVLGTSTPGTATAAGTILGIENVLGNVTFGNLTGTGDALTSGKGITALATDPTIQEVGNTLNSLFSNASSSTSSISASIISASEKNASSIGQSHRSALLSIEDNPSAGRSYALYAQVERLFEAGDIAEVIPLLDRLFSGEFDTYFGQTVERELLSLQAIQQRLQEVRDRTGKKSVLIYTFVGQQQLHLVLIAPEGAPIQRTVPEANHQALMAAVEDLQAQIADVTLRETTSYLKPAQQLYQWLLTPLAADLERLEVDTLVFVLDRGLRRLPIATLHDGQQFLVEKYSLGILPSLSLTDTRYASLDDAPLLAMGMSEQFPDRQNPLPAVPIELSAISKRLGNGTILLNQNFTLNNLQQQRQTHPFRIVHLATHGRFNAGTPDNSYLQLWDRKLNFQAMGNLKWDDPPVELLVLSACHTAVGTEDVALGFAGLAVQTGAKSALASLWYVSDLATLGLITEFYDRLNTAPIKAEALQQAQIAMLKGAVRVESGRLVNALSEDITLPSELAKLGDRRFVHPYYWAGFTMVGNPW